jgi:hypothetical protein
VTHFPNREAVCFRARMNWILPKPLLLFAGVVALLPLVAIDPRSAPRARHGKGGHPRGTQMVSDAQPPQFPVKSMQTPLSP